MSTRELVLEGTRDYLWTAAFAVAALVAAVCLTLLFQYERRLISRRLGVGLLALRLAAVGVLLLALLEPQLRTSYERRQAGRIVVAVDVSQSMETADKALSDAELLRLARALGMIGNAATDAQLDAWLEALEDNRAPGWVAPDEAQDPEKSAALAEARLQSLRDLRRELTTLPRTEIARRLLTGGRPNLLDRLAAIGDVEQFLFAAGISETTVDDLATQIEAPPAAAGVESSDLAQPLSSGGSDAPLTAVVILSDGRDTVHKDVTELVTAAQNAGAPVFPVLIGSEHRPRDIAVVAIDAPATVFLNDHPVAQVSLRTTGFAGQSFDVTLTPEGSGIDAQPITQSVTPQAETAEVRFDLPAESVGRRRYAVSVAPQAGETRDDNNSRTFAFQVVNDRARVLLVDSDARWEFRYLVAALQRDKRVQVDPVLFRQPYLGLLPDTFFPRKLSSATEPETDSGTPFEQYDALLIGDLEPQQLSPNDWENLQRYVREAGGTLVLMAGKRFMPLGYPAGALAGLLPIEQPEVVGSTPADALLPPQDRGFRLQPTPDGETAGILALDGDQEQSRRIWSQLPGHEWGLRGRAKAGSTVWATAVRAGERPDLQAERSAALIVEQHLGAGRVVWIGIDSTWRWRAHIGDLYHHKFWGQLVRSAAEFKAAAHNDIVQFGPDRPQIDAGDSALFRARWSELFLKQHPELKARVELTRVDVANQDGAVVALLTPHKERSHDFETRVPGLGPGEYRARLVVDNAGEQSDDIAAELIVRAKSTPELADLTANRALLQRMAEASGGALLLPDQLDKLPEQLQGKNSTEQIRQSLPLWNHWSVLLLFCALVGTEWLLRKLNGLP
ncbi:MAG: hypothetical protein JNG89_09370 [Planctomycetaceae bacterium]|nr:hypothetical protein [Planctomycetaceae bacterium]